MLKPPAIVFAEPTEILAVRGAGVSRSENKVVFQPTSGPTQNRLPISFEALEESDGAVVQIVFAGDLMTPIRFEGTFVGVPRPEDAAHVAQKARSSSSLGLWFFGAGWLMFVLYVAARFRKKRSAFSLLCVSLVCEVVAVIFRAYGYFGAQVPRFLLR
jgi:hypothetical protein